jgi:hypothetical protein
VLVFLIFWSRANACTCIRSKVPDDGRRDGGAPLFALSFAYVAVVGSPRRRARPHKNLLRRGVVSPAGRPRRSRRRRRLVVLPSWVWNIFFLLLLSVRVAWPAGGS